MGDVAVHERVEGSRGRCERKDAATAEEGDEPMQGRPRVLLGLGASHPRQERPHVILAERGQRDVLVVGPSRERVHECPSRGEPVRGIARSAQVIEE
jgi:hypothetical protein